MREVSFFHFRYGVSLMHRHDARLKLLELLVWSVLTLIAKPPVIALIGLITVLMHILAKTRLAMLRRPLIFWLIMSIAMVLMGGLSDVESRLSLGAITLPVGKNGLLMGALRSARLLVLLLAAELLAVTTDPWDLAAAIKRVFVFLPIRWRGSLAAAISLTLAFIPMLLDEAATVRDAALCRGLRGRGREWTGQAGAARREFRGRYIYGGLFRRALVLSLPMAGAALRRADLCAEALLSRCYVDNPSTVESKLTLSDLPLALLLIAPPVALALLLEGI